MDNKKEQIRVLISNICDLQKLRIAAGNRLVQSFYIQMGVQPGMSPENIKKALQDFYKNGKDTSVLEASIIGEKLEGQKSKPKTFLELLLDDYKKISDIIVEENSKIKTIKSAIKSLDGNNQLNIIRDENDAKLIKSYMLLKDSEDDATKVLEKYVQEHPMWKAFFEGVKGCGPLMSGVCLAYLDPYKARHVSCFFRYAGLDTVQDEDKDGNKIFLALDNDRRKVAQVFNEEGSYNYVDCETGELYDGPVVVSCHGRRMGDTEMQNYYVIEDGERVLAIDKETGEPLLKRGITYNPKLKTKLMGVLTGCLLKAKDPVYSKIYYDQRQRLDNSTYHKDKSDGQKNMMAQRYMVKEFLRAMWITWRQLEGLEVDEPYEVAKLGHKPHKYNEAQCKAANQNKQVV